MKRILNKKRMAVLAAASLVLTAATQGFAALTNGLVAYWPFDIATGCNDRSPDVVNGYDMLVIYGGPGTPTNFNANLHLTNDAIRGSAVYVNNAGANPQMAMAFISGNTNDLAPVHRYSPSSNTVSFWMKTDGNHPAANNDMRVWQESDFPKSLASVFNFSAVGAGYDFFIRQNGTVGAGPTNYGNFSGGSHVTGGGGAGSTVADGTWHNVTIVTVPINPGVDLTANWTVYVDGVLDTSFNGSTGLAAKSDGRWKLDTVGLFALVRKDNPAGYVTNCIVDDLAEWARVLTTDEIMDFMANGITNASSGVPPLSISKFSRDLGEIISGAAVQLSWQVNPDVTNLTISAGVGNILPITTCGVGSITVNPTADTTYTLTAQRAGQTVTADITIDVVSGVAAGWNVVGGFNPRPLGNLGNQGNWESLFSSPETSAYGPAVVLDTVTGNHVLGLHGQPVLSAGAFGGHSIGIGGSNTLFFRFYLDANINTLDPLSGIIPDVDVSIGVSEQVLRDVVDFEGDNKGPSIRLFRSQFGLGGPIDLTANFGPNAAVGTYSYVASVDSAGLSTGVVYNVWIDIYNNQNDNDSASHYSVYLQPGGDAGVMSSLFLNQISDRQTNSNETLNKAFIAANKLTPAQGTNVVLLDDFYISTGGGFDHSLPVPQGSFVLGTPSVPSSITLGTVTKTGNSVTLNWNTVPSGSFTYTVWRRDTITGTPQQLQSGISVNTYTDTTATGNAGFYQITSP